MSKPSQLTLEATRRVFWLACKTELAEYESTRSPTERQVARCALLSEMDGAIAAMIDYQRKQKRRAKIKELSPS